MKTKTTIPWAAKSKPKTKYSYFCHVNPTSFGNPDAATFLARRDNKTGEFSYVYYDRKLINPISSTKSCEDMVALGTWVPANQTEINKIKRLYRKPKYLYYRHSKPNLFGNPNAKNGEYILRREMSNNKFFTMGFYDKGINREVNPFVGECNVFLDAIEKGIYIPARPKEIKLAIKLNK